MQITRKETAHVKTKINYKCPGFFSLNQTHYLAANWTFSHMLNSDSNQGVRTVSSEGKEAEFKMMPFKSMSEIDPKYFFYIDHSVNHENDTEDHSLKVKNYAVSNLFLAAENDQETDILYFTKSRNTQIDIEIVGRDQDLLLETTFFKIKVGKDLYLRSKVTSNKECSIISSKYDENKQKEFLFTFSQTPFPRKTDNFNNFLHDFKHMHEADDNIALTKQAETMVKFIMTCDVNHQEKDQEGLYIGSQFQGKAYPEIVHAFCRIGYMDYFLEKYANLYDSDTALKILETDFRDRVQSKIENQTDLAKRIRLTAKTIPWVEEELSLRHVISTILMLTSDDDAFAFLSKAYSLIQTPELNYEGNANWYESLPCLMLIKRAMVGCMAIDRPYDSKSYFFSIFKAAVDYAVSCEYKPYGLLTNLMTADNPKAKTTIDDRVAFPKMQEYVSSLLNKEGKLSKSNRSHLIDNYKDEWLLNPIFKMSSFDDKNDSTEDILNFHAALCYAGNLQTIEKVMTWYPLRDLEVGLTDESPTHKAAILNLVRVLYIDGDRSHH